MMHIQSDRSHNLQWFAMSLVLAVALEEYSAFVIRFFFFFWLLASTPPPNRILLDF